MVRIIGTIRNTTRSKMDVEGCHSNDSGGTRSPAVMLRMS